MRLLFEPLPVYFMHVPKTGGVALGQWLRCAYGRGYFDLDLPQITKLTGRDIRGFNCYHAWHHSRSLFEWLGRPNLAVITMLRDPIERVASAFHFRQRNLVEHPEEYKGAYRTTMKRLPKQSLQESLEDGLITPKLSNTQVRLLGLRNDYGAFFSALHHNPRAEMLLRPYGVPLLVDPDNLPLLYVNAQAWLDEMAVVGLTERYTESVQMMADLLGIPAPADLPLVNANPQRRSPSMRYRDSLPPDVVKQLEELNSFDLELYAHAAELFERQWARYQARPRRTYSIAPRLRIPLRRVESGLKSWLRRTSPASMQRLRELRAKLRRRRTRNGGQG